MEIRECWAISDEEYLDFLRGRKQWKGLRTLAMIISERRMDEKTEMNTRYYISSLPLDVKNFLKAKRSHWKSKYAQTR